MPRIHGRIGRVLQCKHRWWGTWVEFIGFCGKVYPFLNYSSHAPTKQSAKDFCIYYNPWRVELIPETINDGRTVLKWVDVDVQHRSRWKAESIQRKEHMDEEAAKLQKYFREHRVPIFHYDLLFNTLTLNPRLNNYAFYKVRDALTAWREVEAYVGNELANQAPPPVEVKDELRVKAHGFDDKSFRRQVHPSKPRGVKKRATKSSNS